MPGLQAADMDAVQEAIDALKDAGLDVQALGEVEPTERGVAFDVRVSAPTNYEWLDQSSAPPGESDSVDEPEGHNDAADDDHGGGPDVAALPEVTRRGDPFHGEPADARVGRSISDETETDDTVEAIGVYLARDYGVPLSSVAAHVDADRVTVVDQPYGADLVPGTDADGPDYAVQQHNIQLGNPGRKVIGAAPDEDIRAFATAEGVRLELVDDGSDDYGIDDQSSERVWCGACGTGPFTDAEAVADHHEREGHPGDPVPKSTDPSEAAADAGEETTADGGVAVQGPPSTDTAASVTCQNCGARVSQRYVKVWAPEDREDIGPRTCPNCDKVRERDGTVRKPRSTGGQPDV